jgi:hypothetical protein
MTWHMQGHYYAPCSCKVGCPCVLGELEADQGWCSACLVFDIDRGEVDAVDVSGTKGALLGDWPSGFLSGNGTGRMYFDPSDSQEQRDALESVFEGKKGGAFEVIAGLLSSTLPTEIAPITIERHGDATRVTVGDVVDISVTDLKGPTGELTRVLHGAAAFRENIILGKSSGRSRVPEMRAWEAGGHGEREDFDFSA